jgi:beta-lactamase class A
MQTRRPQYNPAYIILTAVLAVLFTAALAVALVFVTRYSSTTAAFKEFAVNQSESVKAELDELNAKLEELQSQAGSLESEKAELIRTFNDSDLRYKMLNERVAELESRLAAKQAEIDSLLEDIAKLERVYKVDMNAQFKIIAELEELLSTGAPLKQVKTTETDESGEETEVTVEEYPRISLFYQDITHGYTYSYNDGEVFYSASLLKAPFALSLLQAATAELAAMETGSETGSETSPERVYNFDEVYTYVTSDAQSGSGIIVKEPEGTKYTYLQLIELMLTHSDNVAFDQLKKKYSTAEFRTLASKLGTTAMRKDLATMTASDGGKVMAAIYDFIQSDSPYSKFMYDAMAKSIHRVMIPAAVPGKPVAHKYGWDIDAYHDMGIVFDKNPYIVVILTDLDQGGTEVDEYIRDVLKLVSRLHENFYK